jgi:hypothetical protein
MKIPAGQKSNLINEFNNITHGQITTKVEWLYISIFNLDVFVYFY